MIYYDTSKDKECKAIVKWCKDHNYIYGFETKDKFRSLETYPFNILAPSYMEDDLIEKLEALSY